MSDDRCRHAWSDSHVCEACGAIRYASAPMWAVLADISSGPRAVWLALWISADRDTEAPRPVFTGNKRIAARAGGISPRSVQRHLDWLAEHGWIRATVRPFADRTRRYIDLAWGAPREDWISEYKSKSPAKSVATGDDIVTGVETTTATDLSQTMPGLSPGATDLSPPHDNIVAHTLGGYLGDALDLPILVPPTEPDGQLGFALSPPQVAESPTPKRDLPAEVLDYLNETKAALRLRLGLRGSSPHSLTPKVRKWIADRIKDLGGGDIGVDACKRVIDVQAKDAERAGKDTEANGWRYFGVDMFSYDDAFARKLELWREDGNHRSFGYPTAKRGERQSAPSRPNLRNAAAPGQNQILIEEGERLAREERQQRGEP